MAASKPAAYAPGLGLRPGVAVGRDRANSSVPASFTWGYANSAGATRKLRIGDPTLWLTTQQSGTVVAASTFSYSYDAAMLNAFLTGYKLSIYRIDVTTSSDATQFDQDFIYATGYMDQPKNISLNNVLLSARNNMAQNSLLLSIYLDEPLGFGIDGALFWNVINGQTVGVTCYFNAIN
jgi:hypothetical protein